MFETEKRLRRTDKIPKMNGDEIVVVVGTKNMGENSCDL